MKRMTKNRPMVIPVRNGSLTTEWMKTHEVAEYLRTSPNNVRNLVYKGKLNPKQKFGRLYFSKSEVLRLIDNQGDQYVY